MTTETLKDPSIILQPSPVGIDAAIQSIQVALNALPWLQKSFGRAHTIPRMVIDKKRIEPMVYQGTSEYYPVLPNDALTSYSFWRVNSPRVTEEYQANLNYGGKYFFKDPVDGIFWIDLQKVDASKNYIFREELIRDVMNILNRNPSVSVVRVWDDRVEDIYKGYTLFDTHRDLLMYPYTAFRLECFLRYEFQCQP